jgi:hypothetical protein
VLSDGEQVLVLKVDAEAFSEHEERFGPVVLDDFLACLVKEFIFHFKALSQ